MIPRLRKAGIYVERSKRPFSRGTKIRLYRPPDQQIAIVYSLRELEAWTAYLLDGGPEPKAPHI